MSFVRLALVVTRRLDHTCRRTISTFFFFNAPATTEIYTLSLHDALPIWGDYRDDRLRAPSGLRQNCGYAGATILTKRSEEHTSELQSLRHLVCRLLLEKKKNTTNNYSCTHTTPSHRTHTRVLRLNRADNN